MSNPHDYNSVDGNESLFSFRSCLFHTPVQSGFTSSAMLRASLYSGPIILTSGVTEPFSCLFSIDWNAVFVDSSSAFPYQP